MKVDISCGGTGGHVLPGLAVAEELRRRGHGVRLWLTGRDTEQILLERWDGPILTVKSAGLQNPFTFSGLGAFARLLLSVRKSISLLKKDRPDVLLAMGGYASVPPVAAARFRKISVVLHEGNAVPGKAVRLLAPHADCVALAYASACGSLDARRTEVTGFPLPQSRPADSFKCSPAENEITLLVTGGSQGAEFLNSVGVDAVCSLAEKVSLHVIHIAGKGDVSAISGKYTEAGIHAEVVDFVRDMYKVYACVDIAIGRSGAAFCAEICRFGLPSILVPYPYAAGAHQRLNAEGLEQEGGVWILDQSELTSAKLAGVIRQLAENSDLRESMKRSLAAAAEDRAAQRVADVLENVAGRREGV